MIRNALVTGASAGIGRELVKQLVRDRGMTVLATARRGERLESLARELPDGKVKWLAGDLADASFRERLWNWAVESAGSSGLDLVVNNAGVGHYSEFADELPEEIRKMIELNVVALFDLTQRAARHMKARGSGQICEVSSVLGFMGLPYSAVYVATKHAVNGLVKSLRYELRGTGVRVWAACPAQTESEFFEVALGESAAHGPKPHGEPTEQVVRAIVHGLDRRAAFVIPSTTGRLLVGVMRWLPGPFEWAMQRFAARFFGKQIRAARGETGN